MNYLMKKYNFLKRLDSDQVFEIRSDQVIVFSVKKMVYYGRKGQKMFEKKTGLKNQPQISKVFLVTNQPRNRLE